MSLTATEIALVLVEVESDCVGHRLTDAKPLADEPGLLLEFGRTEIVLATATECARIHRASRRPRTKPADDFCGAVRKRFEGRRLATLVQVDGDRIVRFDFGDAGGLVAELFGRRGGLFVVDAARIVTHALLPQHAKRIGTLHTVVDHARTAEPQPRFGDAPSCAIASTYEPRVDAAALDAAKRAALTPVRAEKKRAEKKREKLVAELARADDAPKLRRDAGLLLAHLRTLPPGATRVTVDDLHDPGGAPIEINIDPRLGPKGTALRAFKLARRLDRSRAIIAAEIARCDAVLVHLVERERSIQQVVSIDNFDSLGHPASAPRAITGHRKDRARTPDEKKPYKSYTATDGSEIRVGRGAKENDALTFRHANGNDVWMHARDYPGSHVVIPVRRGASTSDATLREAALLAAHFSGAKGEKVVDVTLTERKHVSKSRGAKPGLVSVARARTITVRVDADAVRALVDRSRDT
ncbi:MAG: DUF814 domain-containing protein [Deltaproteobacteria bacterium]|nr:DUF814 domain-containing protein [Deltaproteobacteria bacterium]